MIDSFQNSILHLLLQYIMALLSTTRTCSPTLMIIKSPLFEDEKLSFGNFKAWKSIWQKHISFGDAIIP